MSWGNAGKDAMAGAGAGAAFGPWGALIGGVGGGILGAFSSDGPDLNSIYGGLQPTDVQTLINAGKVGGTSYDQIQEDPATRAAQMGALSYLQNVGNTQGMDLQSQVAQRQAMQAANQNDASNRAAVLNQMAMRGMRGGGAELAEQLSGAQSSAQANSMAGAQFASDARTRALQAMMGSGQLGGQVRGQDWSNASDRAAARDRINQFNAQNARSAYAQNWQEQMQKATGQASVQPTAYAQNVGQAGAVGYLGGMGADWWNKQNKQQPQSQDGQPGTYSSVPPRY